MSFALPTRWRSLMSWNGEAVLRANPMDADSAHPFPVPLFALSRPLNFLEVGHDNVHCIEAEVVGADFKNKTVALAGMV